MRWRCVLFSLLLLTSCDKLFSFNPGAALVGDGAADRAVVPDASPSFRWSQVTLGETHSCGLDDQGRAYCWGWGAYGQLGTGEIVDDGVNVPRPVQLPDGKLFKQIDAGAFHTCGVTAAGALYCWGHHGNGRLGHADLVDHAPAPVAVDASGIPAARFEAVSAGQQHSCALAEGGVAYCWGYDGQGQLGDGGGFVDSPRPVAVDVSAMNVGQGSRVFRSLSAGSVVSCGVTDDGVGFCWGWNDYGSLGTGTGLGGAVNRPEQPVDVTLLGGDPRLIRIGAFVHACALSADGQIACWGRDIKGTLGTTGAELMDCIPTNDRCADRPVPLDRATVGDVPFVKLAVGSLHNCALAEAGVYCWGAGAQGALGTGGTPDSAGPMAVKIETVGLTALEQIAASQGGHSCGIDEGKLYCWGSNEYGKLGDGSTASLWTVPTPVFDPPPD